MNQRLQPNRKGTRQDAPSALGAPEDMVDHQMHTVPIMLIFHVDTVLYSNRPHKKVGPFICRLKAGSFLIRLGKVSL